MDGKNLFEYILHSNPKDKDLLQLMKFNVINKIYYYGDHFKLGTTTSKSMFVLKSIFEGLYVFYANMTFKKKSLPMGLTSGYEDANTELYKNGFCEERMVSAIKKNNRVGCDVALFVRTKKIMWSFAYCDFNYLISREFLQYIREYVIKTERFLKNNNYDFLVVPNDTDFFSRVYLKIFKQHEKPSFLFMHGGIPNIYDRIMDNGSDYIVSWGQKQSDAYIKMGFDRNKMFHSGHPFYKREPRKLNFSFENILVITKSLNGVCPLEKPHLEDRGNAIMYLYSIMNTLKKTGVSKVRFRPHPSENENWYLRFLDLNFFVVDSDSLSNSIAKSSLVIGPASTTIIDALANEVNYLIYEPLIDGKTIMGHNVNPPLDGTDDRIPVARNEEELLKMLAKKRAIDVSVYAELAPKYNLDFLKGIVK